MSARYQSGRGKGRMASFNNKALIARLQAAASVDDVDLVLETLREGMGATTLKKSTGRCNFAEVPDFSCRITAAVELAKILGLGVPTKVEVDGKIAHVDFTAILNQAKQISTPRVIEIVGEYARAAEAIEREALPAKRAETG